MTNQNRFRENPLLLIKQPDNPRVGHSAAFLILAADAGLSALPPYPHQESDATFLAFISRITSQYIDFLNI